MAKTKKYAVPLKPRQTVIIGGKGYGPGCVIPDLNKKAQKELIERGLVVPLEEIVQEKPEEEVGGDAPPPHTKQNLNPADLEGKSLDELNVMIDERHGEPAETVEDAVAWLTEHFQD